MNTTTDLPNRLDAVLKAEITKYLSDHSDSICANIEVAHQSFLDIMEPMWGRQMVVNEEVERYYCGSVGNRSVVNASQFVTNMMSILVPVFMRPQRFLQELGEEAKDQLANQHVNYNLSRLTGIPFPLLLPTQFDELGDVTEIHDLIVVGPDGKPLLTQWAAPVITALQEEGVNLPDELAQLIMPPDSFV
jgi:hypothetical protein